MSLNYKSIAVILISSCSTSMAFADPNCSLSRFPVLEDLLQTTVTIDASLPYLEPSRNISKARLAELNREKNEIPVDLSLSAQSFKESDLNTDIEADRDINEVSLNIGLDLWNEHARRKVTRARISTSSNEITKIENEIAGEILNSALDISETQALITILETRNNLLVTKVEYYTLREKLGETVARDLLQARTDQIENQNKIISARVKLSTLAGKLNIGLTQAEKIPTLSPYHQIDSKFACAAEDYLVTEARDALKLAEARLLQRQMNFSPKVSGFVRKSRSRTDQGVFQETEKIGVDLSIQFFSGGRNIFGIQNSVDQIDVATENLSLAKIRSDRQIDQRRETEYVYQQNAKSISADLEGKEALLEEIRERRDLGQSVYEEMVDTALEISRLRESRLSVVSRFFKGWVDYLESTNKLDVSNIQL